MSVTTMRTWMAIVVLATLSAASVALGAEERSGGIWTFLLENDKPYRSDRNYTNGVAVIWVPDGDSTPDWVLRIAHWIPWMPEGGRIRHGFAFGQNMYTPRDLSLADPPLSDRPYAGWLYGTIGLGVETGRQLDQVSLTLGVIGPASLAGESQTIFHRIIKSDKPRGWDTQLGNEPGFFLTNERAWRELATANLAGLDLDLTPHAGGALGNVYTYADTGLTVRCGRRLPPDYGPPRIQPSSPGSGFLVRADRFAWYLSVGLDARAVARNIFLDGNTFRDSRSVDKEPLVGDLHWGLVAAWRRVRVSYTHVVRTREFTTQGKHDEFGAFSLSTSF